MAVIREEIITCLNDLIETCRNSENGFLTASEHTSDGSLKTYFRRCSDQRAQFASELQGEVRHLGGETAAAGSISGAFHRGWMNLRSAIAQGDEAILSECEWGENAALRNYERVLNQNLPHNVLPVVKHHYMQIKDAHKQIRDLEKRAA